MLKIKQLQKLSILLLVILLFSNCDNRKTNRIECFECSKEFNGQRDLDRHSEAKHSHKKRLIFSIKLLKYPSITPYQDLDTVLWLLSMSFEKQWESGNIWANTYQICKFFIKKFIPINKRIWSILA